MNIEVFGAGDRTRVAKHILKDADIPTGCGIKSIKLLPIPTSRDGVHITGTEHILSSLIDSLEPEDYLIGYGLGEAGRASLERRRIAYYDASLDEDFLTENAYITAVGTLAYLFGSDRRIPADLSLAVFGYGRIGKALLRMLLFFEGDVTVFSCKEETRLELASLGIKSGELSPDAFPRERLSELDIIINTAPCKLSGLFEGGVLPGELRVLDLASGDSFEGVKGVERLPSLPDRMYPISAGVSYARHALRHLNGM